MIRPYRDTDRDTVKAITVEAFGGVAIEHAIEQRFGMVADHDWRWRKARHIDADVEASGAVNWVAEDESGAVVGYVTTRIDREAGVGFIVNLAVRADQRGQGVGRQLIEHALDHFRAVGLELARIETLAQNRIGQALYPSCGFVEVARQVHYAQRLRVSDGAG
jgi:ribosomal protein S18 acetylase RimI-like enzyme